MNNLENNIFSHNCFQQQQIQYNAYVKNTFQMNNSTSSKIYLSNNQLTFGFPQDLLSFGKRRRRESDSENMMTQFSPETEQRFVYKQHQQNFINKNQDIYSSKQNSNASQINVDSIQQNPSNLSTSTSSQASSGSSSSQSSSSSLQSQICSSSFLSSTSYPQNTSSLTSQQFNEKSNSSNSFAFDNVTQKKKFSFGSNSMSQQPLQQSQINNLASNHNQQEASKFKTEMCKNWMEFGKCNYGKKCQFAHGKNELVDKSLVNKRQYKSKLCNSFHTQKFCPYGNRCMFIHENRTISEIKQSTYYQKVLYNLCEQEDANKIFCLQMQEPYSETAEIQQNISSSSMPKLQKSLEKTPIKQTTRLPIFLSIVSQQQELKVSQSSYPESITK